MSERSTSLRSTALLIWLERLSSSDPMERETSITALEQLGDTDALPALAEVFATDPVPALRAMAQQAGKAIYYGVLRQTLDGDENIEEASEEERRRAAQVLAEAQARKLRKKGQ